MARVEDGLARIIRPIVEGQIRSFLNDHPVIAEAVNWRFSAPSKREALVASIGKRINRDLLCGATTARLAAALLEPSTGAQAEGDGVGVVTAPSEAGDGSSAVPRRVYEGAE